MDINTRTPIKSGIVAVAALLATISVAWAAEEYTSKEGNFWVELPAKAKVTKQRVNTRSGPQLINMVRNGDKDGIISSVSFSEVPADRARAADTTLDDAVDGMFANGKLIEDERQTITFEGHPGREVRFHMQASAGVAGKDAGQARALLIGRRLYQIMILGPESKTTPERCKKFFDSFALLEKVPAAAAAPATASATPTGKKTDQGMALDPDGDCKILTDRSGAAMVVPNKLHDLATNSGVLNAPRILRDVNGDFTAEVEVSGLVEPQGPCTRPDHAPYYGAGLVFWSDSGHFVRLERAVIDRGGPFSLVNFERFDGGDPVAHAGGFDSPYRIPIQLRLARRGNSLEGSFSFDRGATWKALQPMDIPWAAAGQVGVIAINTTSKPLNVQFRKIKVESP